MPPAQEPIGTRDALTSLPPPRLPHPYINHTPTRLELPPKSIQFIQPLTPNSPPSSFPSPPARSNPALADAPPAIRFQAGSSSFDVMVNGTGSEEMSPLMAELSRALQLVRELETYLSRTSDAESCRSLAPQILSSIQKSIRMARSGEPDGERQDSPRSENSSPAFKDQDHGHKEMMKKRKGLHKWTKQVLLVAGAGGVEGPIDDGYSWRKYGQKDILGAKHPRAYYRCTHRNTQGCLATKQVQRSDNDPLLFDITYLGTHSCLQRPQQGAAPAQQKPFESRGANGRLQQQPQQENPNLLLSFQTELKVKTEGLESEEARGQAYSLTFSMATSKETPAAADFFSPTFLSPVTSESTYFSMSPYQISGLEGGMNLQASDSDITEIISRANSASNSSLVDMDFMLDQLDFNQDFQFDASSFFS